MAPAGSWKRDGRRVAPHLRADGGFRARLTPSTFNAYFRCMALARALHEATREPGRCTVDRMLSEALRWHERRLRRLCEREGLNAAEVIRVSLLDAYGLPEQPRYSGPIVSPRSVVDV